MGRLVQSLDLLPRGFSGKFSIVCGQPCKGRPHFNEGIASHARLDLPKRSVLSKIVAEDRTYSDIFFGFKGKPKPNSRLNGEENLEYDGMIRRKPWL